MLEAMTTSGSAEPVDIGDDGRLELVVVRDVLLHEPGPGEGPGEVGREGEARRRGTGSEADTLEQRPEALDVAPQPFLGTRRGIGGDDVDAARKEERRPAHADEPGAHDRDTGDVAGERTSHRATSSFALPAAGPGGYESVPDRPTPTTTRRRHHLARSEVYHVGAPRANRRRAASPGPCEEGMKEGARAG